MRPAGPKTRRDGIEPPIKPQPQPRPGRIESPAEPPPPPAARSEPPAAGEFTPDPTPGTYDPTGAWPLRLASMSAS